MHKPEFFLGKYADAVDRRLKLWAEQKIVERIWNKDATVWVPKHDEAEPGGPADRMGWLDLPESMRKEVDELLPFAQETISEGFNRVVLLGMGGSSLAPEVLMAVFGNRTGYLPLTVLDSTNPATVQRILGDIDIGKTLFLVSSKSGNTVETLCLFRFFFHKMDEVKGDPGSNFLAITDPGSRLEKEAAEKGFRRIFSAPPDVGGRYSALSYFGLVPAALMGVDLKGLLDRARDMSEICSTKTPLEENFGILLGAAMGELALAGRDKITFFESPAVSSLGAWLEQLIAESTGKNGKGILPVAREVPSISGSYGNDRLFVYLRLSGDDEGPIGEHLRKLRENGHPVITIQLDDRRDLGAEFFMWEMATAASAAVLGVNPFDQPNVEASKAKTRELMEAHKKGGIPREYPLFIDGRIEVYGEKIAATGSTSALLEAFLNQAGPGDYLAIMAYVPRTEFTDQVIETLRTSLRDRLHAAVTSGYGPRFLHSTGQLHKGDGNKGLFIQITHEPGVDLPVPGEGYSFGTLILAQALGDYQALKDLNRRLIRFHIKSEVIGGLKLLASGLL